jgi:hypothetical protein
MERIEHSLLLLQEFQCRVVHGEGRLLFVRGSEWTPDASFATPLAGITCQEARWQPKFESRGTVGRGVQLIFRIDPHNDIGEICINETGLHL